MTSIHSIDPTSGGVALEPIWKQATEGLAAGYTALVPVRIGEATFLYAYARTTQVTDVYELSSKPPWLRRRDARPVLSGGPAWDRITAFVLGNEPYLMCYERAQGAFGFFHIARDLTVSRPYSFAMARNTPTTGFTDVAAYSSLGQLTFTGYDSDTGTVASFGLSVTTSTVGDALPLLAQSVWFHRWAKGWTHFVFFQLGGANFFFKINTAKLNVNIDHMQDDPAKGSVEVGSQLQAQLPDALAITHAARVPWAHGEPRLLTYIAGSGAASAYRIHADCQGWTELAGSKVERGATLVVPYRIADESYVLFYRGD